MPKKDDQPTAEGFAAAAWLLLCDVAAMRAVAEVEAGAEGAFLDSGEPIILYEPHLFDRFTGGKFRGLTVAGLDPKHAQLSYKSWRPGAYGPQRAQHVKLAAAAKLDRDAALRATSWGLFQILGDNFRAAGYGTLQRFINAAYRSADDHLRMLTMFIRSNDRLVDAIRAQDWVTFASVYNGPGYAVNRYDEKLAAAFDRARAA